MSGTVHLVYRYFDAEDLPLYVGCTADLKARFEQHRASHTWWTNKVHRQELTSHPTREDALAVEAAEIRRLSPLHNGQLYLMAPAEWELGQFIAYGRAQLEAPGRTDCTLKDAMGQAWDIYARRFRRCLFEDCGSVKAGTRRSPAHHGGPRRRATFTALRSPNHPVPDRAFRAEVRRNSKNKPLKEVAA